jgi:hypothetical protein
LNPSVPQPHPPQKTTIPRYAKHGGWFFPEIQQGGRRFQLTVFFCSYFPPFDFFATKSRKTVNAVMASVTSCLRIFGELGWGYGASAVTNQLGSYSCSLANLALLL